MDREARRIGTGNWNKGELEAVEVDLELQSSAEHGPQIIYVSLYPQREEHKLTFTSLWISSSKLTGLPSHSPSHVLMGVLGI